MNKNINFNKNETETKIEKPTKSFRETNFQLMSGSQIKSKTDELDLAKEKKEHFL